MPIQLYRIDDRMIHGQVVVGWGQPLDIHLLVLVDDVVASSEWEQELYRMAVPPEMDIRFESVAGAAACHDEFAGDKRNSIFVVPDIPTMQRLVVAVPDIKSVNIGGLHHRAGRNQKLRYVFLTPDEEKMLSDLASKGVTVTAQDVPSARVVPLEELVSGEAAA
ncbi:MAG: PTS sugar transporter subunit IIB [Gemmatimonadaceae bacterium]|nr:PTS sugar transporter subunit IIB [Gemmatimonadaceae bacterium]